MDITDPTFWRGIERLIIVLSAALFGFLGYKLYIKGMTKSKNSLNVQSPQLKFARSGTGPGLMFMAFGALILVWLIFNGGAFATDTKQIKKLESKLETLGEIIRTIDLQAMRDPHEEIKELRFAIDELNRQNKKMFGTRPLNEPYIRSQCKLIDSSRKKGLLYCPEGYVLVGAENHPQSNDALDKLICCPVE